MKTRGGDGEGGEGGKEAVLGGLGAVRDQVDGEVFHDPAADDGVVGHDEGRDQEGQDAQKIPLLIRGAEGPEGVLPGPAADGHVRGQEDEAEGQHQHQVDKEEEAAAILGAEVGEAPDIADAHGAAGRRQHVAERGAEAAVLFHIPLPFLPGFPGRRALYQRKGQFGKRRKLT